MRSVDGIKFGKAIKEPQRPPLIGTEPGVTTPVPDFISPRIQKAPVGVKIAQGNLDIFQKEWNLREDSLKPGPGQYEARTEFE